MDLELNGKTILIVGASGGIGAATARLLHREGANLALVARREQSLQNLAVELDSTSESIMTVAGDAAAAGTLEDIAERVVRRFGGMDRLVVLAAPMGARASFAELKNSDWEFYFRNSLMIAVQACRATIPALLKASAGAILLTAAYSIRAQKPELVAYTAMKSAVAGLAKNLAKSYGSRGLRVNCIAPGVVERDAVNRRELAQRYGVPESRARYEFVRREFGMNVALERAGRHEEFADLIAYLISNRASYISGSMVNIDGGTDF
jgi:3-oxoacyl-[acyl-carrier protein] reductase